MRYKYLLLPVLLFFSCKKDSAPVPGPAPAAEAYYYPPNTSDEWLSKSAVSINWNESKLTEAFDYAGTKNTFGLIILHHGKIVREQYWNGWDKNTRYYIASAGKSVTAFVAGIAQQNGTINIDNKVSQYLGAGWTSLPPAKENLITVKHQLTMTTGLDDGVPDGDCITPSCLQYKADAGTKWAYHNAPYHLLETVIGNASGMTYNQYCKQQLFDKIGMSSATWFNYVMYCTTREAARFGSLILKKGTWNGTTLLTDNNYYNAMVNTSQSFNLSYGYLWWLNGKSTVMLPGFQLPFAGPLIPNAPADMFMALGKDDKKIYVIPSLDVVVVRLGDAAGTSTAGPSSFDNELWGKLRLAIGY